MRYWKLVTRGFAALALLIAATSAGAAVEHLPDAARRQQQRKLTNDRFGNSAPAWASAAR